MKLFLSERLVVAGCSQSNVVDPGPANTVVPPVASAIPQASAQPVADAPVKKTCGVVPGFNGPKYQHHTFIGDLATQPKTLSVESDPASCFVLVATMKERQGDRGYVTGYVAIKENDGDGVRSEADKIGVIDHDKKTFKPVEGDKVVAVRVADTFRRAGLFGEDVPVGANLALVSNRERLMEMTEAAARAGNIEHYDRADCIDYRSSLSPTELRNLWNQEYVDMCEEKGVETLIWFGVMELYAGMHRDTPVLPQWSQVLGQENKWPGDGIDIVLISPRDPADNDRAMVTRTWIQSVRETALTVGWKRFVSEEADVTSGKINKDDYLSRLYGYKRWLELENKQNPHHPGKHDKLLKIGEIERRLTSPK